MNRLAGGVPERIKEISISPKEFCRTIYLPVRMRQSSELRIPKRFEEYKELILSVPITHDYMYLTVNHGICTRNTYSNRPGWHVDGYLSDDENYVWCSSEPTEYTEQELFEGPDDHEEALKLFDKMLGNLKRLDTNTLYRLGKTIHRTPIIDYNGIRTFVKISCSNEQYNLKGNAVNELFNYDWKYVDRQETRNHPYKKERI